MTEVRNSMTGTPIEELLEAAGSKFSLVTLAAKRARQINAYFGQLGGGLGSMIPPQVTSVAHKPLTIALEEIAVGKVVLADPDEMAAMTARKDALNNPEAPDLGLVPGAEEQTES